MTHHFSMGAINKVTNNYEYPKIATKGKNKYKCPCCEKDVIFKKGLIKQPHFSHYKSDTPCYYYDKPNETQIHKDAKLLMKSLLDNKKHICVHKSCKYCERRNCHNTEEVCYDIDNDYSENTEAVIEYKFYYNNSNRSADIALIEKDKIKDKIKYIFEICYKNKTKEENRPEPWIEINAEDLINKINSGESVDEEGNITITCIRNYKCEKCIEYEEEENIKRNLHYEKLKQQQEEEKIKRKLHYEKLKQEQEDERIRKEEEEKMRQYCKCGIMLMNVCMCETPKYELVKLSNNLFCVSCNKWKCRC